MVYRVADGTINDRLTAQIGRQRLRIASAQEQIASGKRINRPSDDPFGAAAVINLRTSQTALEQFQRNVGAADSALGDSDAALDQYQLILDRISSFLSQGISDFTPDQAKQAIATELDSINQSVLSLANRRGTEGYIFGGTRQEAPPFDPTTAAPAATAASQRTLQLEPDAQPVDIGVTAETVFSNSNGTIFDALTQAAAALRGTGNTAADKATLSAAVDQITAFIDQASTARAKIGKGFNAAENVGSRIERDVLSLEDSALQIEGADFAEASIDLVEAERALEAVLGSGARIGKQSLLDFLG